MITPSKEKLKSPPKYALNPNDKSLHETEPKFIHSKSDHFNKYYENWESHL